MTRTEWDALEGRNKLALAVRMLDMGRCLDGEGWTAEQLLAMVAGEGKDPYARKVG